jgi:hypothetical protein
VTKHRLHLYYCLGRRIRTELIILAALLLILGLIDLTNPIFGDAWWWLWIALLFVVLIWFYYALLTRRASIQVGSKMLRLQGPIIGVNISYGRVHSVTAGKLGQHHPVEKLKRSDRVVVKPLYHRTCAFVELNSTPSAFGRRRLWFSQLLFGTTRPGIICHVDDWMALSREIDIAREAWLTRNRRRPPRNSGTLAGRILAEDDLT